MTEVVQPRANLTTGEAISLPAEDAPKFDLSWLREEGIGTVIEQDYPANPGLSELAAALDTGPSAIPREDHD